MDNNATGEEIKKPVDPENLTEGEKKHIPVIEAPETVIAGEPLEVIVTVGSIPHVMEEKHYIEWIELYLQNKLMGRKELIPSSGEKARAAFRIEAEDICRNCGEKSVIINLRALERCNIHGIWEAHMEIKATSSK